MNQSEYIKWLTARLILEVWSPEKFDFHPFPRMKKRVQLFYRAKGIVCADRALNGKD